MFRYFGNRDDFNAEGVAAARALGARERDVAVRNPDYLAFDFLSARYRLIGSLPLLPRLVLRLWQHKVPGIYHYLNARTHHIDSVLAADVGRGIDQVVIVGAGFDSRPYRMRSVLHRASVYEVDRARALHRKRATLRKRLGGMPPWVRYVECDLARDDLFAELARNGFRLDERAVFVWEGVSYYLEPDAVDRFLDGLGRSAAPGSTLVFDYLYAAALRDDAEGYGVRGAKGFLDAVGQSYRSGIGCNELAQYMGERGFAVVSDLSPADMEARYLTRVDGTRNGRAFAGYGMAHCEVKERAQP